MKHVAALTVLILAATAANAQPGTFLGKSADEWTAKLRIPNAKEQRNAAFALGKIGASAASATPDLLQNLQNSDPSVREASAFALGEIHKLRGGQDVIDALCAAINSDADPLVKRSAAVALGHIGKGTPQVQAALKKAFEDQSPAVKQNVAWALGRLGDEGIATLRKALRDNDANVRRDAAGSVQQLRTDVAHAAVPELVGCVQHSDVEVKKAALQALVRLVEPTDNEAIATISKALSDKDLEVKTNAALALGRIGGKEAATAIPVLVEALRKGDPDLKTQAAAALKNIGPAAKTAVPDLAKALSDPEEKVRKFAAVALTGIAEGATSAIPVLVQVLADKSELPDVRVACAVALSKIGKSKAAVDAVPQLVQILEDSSNDPRVRERTMWALRVHQNELLTLPNVETAMTKILTEPQGAESKMLRYDCAYILGVFKADRVPPQVMDVLLEYLKDRDIKVYDKTAVDPGGGTGEKGTDAAKAKELGRGDGRVMAVQALERIGRERIRQRPEIIAQLEAIHAAPDTVDSLRSKVKSLLEKVK